MRRRMICLLLPAVLLFISTPVPAQSFISQGRLRDYVSFLDESEYAGFYLVDGTPHLVLIEGLDEMNAEILAAIDSFGEEVVIRYAKYSYQALIDLRDEAFDLFDIYIGGFSQELNIASLETKKYTKAFIDGMSSRFPELDMYILMKYRAIPPEYLDEGGWLKTEYENADKKIAAQLAGMLSARGDDQHGGYFTIQNSAFVCLIERDDEIIALADEGHIVVCPVDHSLTELNDTCAFFQNLMGTHGIYQVSVDITRNIVAVGLTEYTSDNIRALRALYPEIDRFELYKVMIDPVDGSFVTDYMH